jgi:hypothetical protein
LSWPDHTLKDPLFSTDKLTACILNEIQIRAFGLILFVAMFLILVRRLVWIPMVDTSSCVLILPLLLISILVSAIHILHMHSVKGAAGVLCIILFTANPLRQLLHRGGTAPYLLVLSLGLFALPIEGLLVASISDDCLKQQSSTLICMLVLIFLSSNPLPCRCTLSFRALHIPLA